MLGKKISGFLILLSIGTSLMATTQLSQEEQSVHIKKQCPDTCNCGQDCSCNTCNCGVNTNQE